MSTSKLSQIKLTLFFFISSFLIIATAQITYMSQDCYNDFGTYNVLSDYGQNIDKAISALASKAATSNYNTATVGTGESKVNAYFSCRYDISPEVCQSCVTSTANNVSWCINSVESFIAYEECTVHYSNRTIFSVMEDLPRYYEFNMDADANAVQISQFLDSHVSDLINEAASSSPRYFATTKSSYTSSKTYYALAQCNPDITALECTTCLQHGYGNFTTKRPSRDYGQIFMPSCRLSYIITSDELSSPWKFSKTFSSLRPLFIPNFGPSSVPDASNFGPSSAPDTSNFGPSSVPDTSDSGPTSVPDTSDSGPSSVPDTRNLGPSSDDVPSNFEPSSVPKSSDLSPISVPGSSDVIPNSFPGSNNLGPSSFNSNFGSAGTRASSTMGTMIAIIFCAAKFLF